MTGTRRLLAVALAAVLVACASGPAPRDHFYRLELPEPCGRYASPVFPGTLLVRRPRGDALTSERNLLYREGDSPEIGQHPYHFWSDHPTTLLREELARYLRASGAADRVVTPELRVDPDYELSTRIVRLERILGDPPKVEAELQLGVTRTEDREVVVFETYREIRESEAGGMADAVDAKAGVLAAIFERFLADSAGDDASRRHAEDCRPRERLLGSH